MRKVQITAFLSVTAVFAAFGIFRPIFDFLANVHKAIFG